MRLKFSEICNGSQQRVIYGNIADKGPESPLALALALALSSSSLSLAIDSMFSNKYFSQNLLRFAKPSLVSHLC